MKIIIPGNPVPQSRPKVRRFRNTIIGYDPSAGIKKDIKEYLLYSEKKNLVDFGTSLLKLNIDFYCQIPKSLSQKKQLLLDNKYNGKRPDLDNLSKLYIDLLQGICFKDDSQICEWSCIKKYSFEPRTEITLDILNDSQ
jgi:Holliday junction resolvase RusA-like endonuclease